MYAAKTALISGCVVGRIVTEHDVDVGAVVPDKAESTDAPPPGTLAGG